MFKAFALAAALQASTMAVSLTKDDTCPDTWNCKFGKLCDMDGLNCSWENW